MDEIRVGGKEGRKRSLRLGGRPESFESCIELPAALSGRPCACESEPRILDEPADSPPTLHYRKGADSYP